MEHEGSGVHTPCGYVHPVMQEPGSGCFNQQHQNQGNQNLYEDRSAENPSQPVPVAPAYLIGQETLGRRGYGAGDEGEDGDQPADGVVDAVVIHSETAQYHPGGVQADEEHQQHTEIEHHSVACDAAAAVRNIFPSRSHIPQVRNFQIR